MFTSCCPGWIGEPRVRLTLLPLTAAAAAAAAAAIPASQAVAAVGSSPDFELNQKVSAAMPVIRHGSHLPPCITRHGSHLPPCLCITHHTSRVMLAPMPMPMHHTSRVMLVPMPMHHTSRVMLAPMPMHHTSHITGNACPHAHASQDNCNKNSYFAVILLSFSRPLPMTPLSSPLPSPDHRHG